MIHKEIESKQGICHYWVNGEGRQTILFTHGATMDHGLFRHQMEHFFQQFKVIGWDVPLHGLSRPYKDFSLQGAAREIIAILDAEKVEKCHLVGQSMGGYISQIAAFEHAGRVSSVTAVDSSPVQLSYYSPVDRWLLSITPSLLKLYPLSVLVRTISTQITVSEEARTYARQVLETYTKTEIATIMAAVYDGLLERDDAVLNCPVLIVYGDRDRTGKVKAYCRRWAAQEKRELKVIPGAAHNANMDHPAAFNQALETFLGGLK